MSYADVIEAIEKLPHSRGYTCAKCHLASEAPVLALYAECPGCSTRNKLRGYATAGGEIEDVIDAVRRWMGTDERGRSF